MVNYQLSKVVAGLHRAKPPQLIGEELLIPTIDGVRLQFWSVPLYNDDDDDDDKDDDDDDDDNDDDDDDPPHHRTSSAVA